MSRYLFTKVFLSYSVDIFRHRFALQLFDAVRVCTGAGEVTGVGRTGARCRASPPTTTALAYRMEFRMFFMTKNQKLAF